jgi:phage-related protein
MATNVFENFKVYLVSDDGINSPIYDYLNNLSTKNFELFVEAVSNIKSLPNFHSTFTNIKHFKRGNFKCYELRVMKKNNICRFFYTIEKPNFVILHGFTKKTQKTEHKEIKQAENNLVIYQKTKFIIPFSYV